MAFAIPKIEYDNVDLTGDITLGDGTITGLSDTDDITVGMFIRMVGIPSTALVGSKTDTTVTCASGVVATASATARAVAFGTKIEFDYPPIEDEGETLTTNMTNTESLSGRRQTSVNNIEATRKMKLSFLSPTIYALVDTFLRNHALWGEEFRYYADKTLTTYVDYSLETFKVVPKKLAPRGVDTYVWEVPLSLRRVL